MSLHMEKVRFNNTNYYSVISVGEDKISRLVIQTSNHNLAQTIIDNRWADGSKIPKETLEGPKIRPYQAGG